MEAIIMKYLFDRVRFTWYKRVLESPVLATDG
jgi:hypothetical protein